MVDYSLRLKQELGSDRIWVAGYSNDVLAYIPSRRVLLEGGYEGGDAMLYYGHPGLWAEGIERKIVHEVHRQFGLKTDGGWPPITTSHCNLLYNDRIDQVVS